MTPGHRTGAISPVGWWDRLAIVLLGAAGCALSYDALQQMAIAIHIRGPLTYLFPLVIDGFIAYGVRALLVLSDAPLRARAYIWALFGGATVASIWANALHAVRLNQQTPPGQLRLGDAVVAVLSTLAPLALAGATHLYILITRHHPADRPRISQAARRRTTQLPDPDQPAPRTANATEAERTGPDRQTQTTSPAPDRTRSARPTGPQKEAGPKNRGSSPTGPDRLQTSTRADQTTTTPSPQPGPDQPPGTPTDHGQPPDHRADRAKTRACADRSSTQAEPSTERTVPGPDRSSHHSADGPGPDRSAAARTTAADRSAEPNAPLPDPDRTARPDPGEQDPGNADRSTQRGTGSKTLEEILPIARKAALDEQSMSRQALLKRLREQDIPLSNERFSELQKRLLKDQALANLPKPKRRSL